MGVAAPGTSSTGPSLASTLGDTFAAVIRHVARLCARCLCASATWLALTGQAHAAPPFEGSTLTLAGQAPVEGLVFAYTLTVRNTGGTTGGVVEIHLPSAAMFARIDGFETASIDHDARRVRWEGPVAPGHALTGTLVLVAGTDAGGQTASIHVTARPWQGEPTYLAHSALVDTAPTPVAFRLGGVGVTAAGVAVLGWLAASVLFWIVMRVVSPRAAAWAPVAIMLPAAFLVYFAALAREDVRILGLPETTCTVVDRVIDSRTSSSSTSRSSGQSTVYAPRLALRYGDDAHPGLAQGFGTGSRLSGASASRAEALLARYAVGAQVPCAVDAQDPRHAYVERGFGGAYLFALIPLPVLALGLWGLSTARAP
jgi:hypothetical protein